MLSFQKTLQAFRCVLAAGLAAACLASCEGLQAIEADVYAERFPSSQTGPVAPVTIVDIDDATLVALGGWPLQRSYYARAALSAFDAGAAVVAIDVMFTEPPARPDDALIEMVASEQSRLVLALDGSSPPGLYLALAQMARRKGHVLASVSANGQVTAVPLVQGYQSFSEAIYMAYCEAVAKPCRSSPRLSPREPAFRGGGEAGWGIDYPFAVATIPRISFRRLLEGARPNLRGRIVIISPSASRLLDMKTLPLENRHPRLEHPGSVAMAYAVETLFRQSEIWSLPLLLWFVVFTVANLLVLTTRARFPALRRDVFWIFILLCLIVGWACFRQLHLYVPGTLCVLNALFLWLAAMKGGKHHCARGLFGR